MSNIFNSHINYLPVELQDLEQEFFYTKEDLEASFLSEPAPDEYYYMAEADGINIPKGFTGTAFGRVKFVDGVARIKKHYDFRMCLIRNCRDITPKSHWDKIMSRNLKRILVIRNAAFGDCLMITPALRALKEKYPSATIHFYGRDDSRVVLEHFPFIDEVITPRTTELGRIVDHYDEVFDLVHTIECNPVADRQHPLDYLEDYLKLDIKHKVPMYRMVHHEVQSAAKILSENFKFDPKRRLVLFQVQATAAARTLPAATVYYVANVIAQAGFNVLIAAHSPIFKELNLFKSKTRHHYISNKSNESEITINKEQYVKVDRDPNIRFIQDILGKVPPRNAFAIGHFCDYMVTVDSFWSHLAPALQKPCVTIYTNTEANARAKYYNNTIVVTPDYSKVPCGPCNGLIDKCPLTPDKTPRCTELVSPKSILDAFFKLVEGVGPVIDVAKDTAKSTGERTRPCPSCGEDHNIEEVTTKGSVTHFHCCSCKTIFTNGSINVESYRKVLKKDKNYRYLRNLKLESYGNKIQDLLVKYNIQLSKERPLTISDILNKKFLDVYSDREWFLKDFKKHCTMLPEASMVDPSDSTKINSDVVFWIQGINETDTPAQDVSSILSKMKDNSFLFLVFLAGQSWNETSNSWTPLLSPVVGLHSYIPSSDSLKELLFSSDIISRQAEFIEVINNPNGSLMIIRKHENKKSNQENS